MSRLVLIGAIATGTSQTLVQSARQRGWSSVIVTAPADNLRGAFGSDVELISGATEAAAVIGELQQRYPGERLLVGCANDKYASLAATVAAALGLPGPAPAVVQALGSKAGQKRAMAAAGLASAGFALVRHGDPEAALDDSLAPLRYPVVVKPAVGISSQGVRLCATPAEVREQLALLAADHRDARRLSPSDQVLVEEFLQGPEYCVELFDGALVGLLRKAKRGGDALFIERGYSSELDLTPPQFEALAGAAEQACRATGLLWGPVHLDVILHQGLPHIIDINPRIAGSFICELVKDAYGFDLVEALLDKLAGRPVAPPRHRQPQAYVRVDYLLDSDPAPWDVQGSPTALHSEHWSWRIETQRLPARERRAYIYFRLGRNAAAGP